MLSSWLPGFGGPSGGELLPVFPWAMNCGEREKGFVRASRARGWHPTALGAFLPPGQVGSLREEVQPPLGPHKP